ncbi:MAG: cell division protein ZapA [Paludibacteraceae bacterium]|nr:cell division protein ZapA [Paludibacteraceae bacterium]
MNNKQHINLRIGAHTVPLNINAEDEPLYRNAAARIIDTYDKYERNFPNRSVEQLWVYVAIELAVNLQSDMRDKQLQPLLDTIQQLNEQIEKAIND